jgi:TadE-like protein
MKGLRQFLDDETGTASIEFLFVFPMVFMLFTAAFESSMYMARFVMMERSVDKVVREIRLGRLDGTLHENLKAIICRNGMMITSVQTCTESMRIWMQPISTANFDMLAPPRSCVDRSQPVNTDPPAATEFTYGTDNEIMLMRICMKEEPMFPTTAISVKMPVDPVDGQVSMVVTSVFVNEPG